MTVRRRLIPYWLLAPGALWLLLFFVIPMGFMAEQALESGSLFTGGFHFTWQWSNFPDSLSGNREQIVRSFYYAGAATVLALADLLPARLRHRPAVGALAAAAAVRGDRPLLHHLPDPHDRLEDDPLRLGAGCRRLPDTALDPPGRAVAGDVDGA